MECKCNSILRLNSSKEDKLFDRKHSDVLLQSCSDKPFISLLSGRSLDLPNYRNQKMNFLNWNANLDKTNSAILSHEERWEGKRYKPHPDPKTTISDKKPGEKQIHVAPETSVNISAGNTQWDQVHPQQFADDPSTHTGTATLSQTQDTASHGHSNKGRPGLAPGKL